eukprot:TRINITY_DN340_c0_g1_i2.p1 TRINITY_DN340_c0_g1~~TRINITY_DN340_c0_g1_i2.p1  ORF type:complete len:231 (-),score=102.01 TRINITY_DN340_c0_g1_i2:36-728(-)
MLRSLVGSEMCIRDSINAEYGGQSVAMGKSCGKEEPPQPSKSKPTVTDQDKALLELKSARDTVKKYKKKLDAKIAEEKKTAKGIIVAGRDEANEAKKARMKKKGIVLLKKIKYQEGLYESAEGQMLNLEQMIAEHEFRQIEVQVVDGTKSFNEAIQALQKEMSVDDVERIMDEAADSMDYVNEINGLLSEQLVDYDDAQVDADLARLMGTTESAPAVSYTHLTLPTKRIV